jgi:hypothetical protein
MYGQFFCRAICGKMLQQDVEERPLCHHAQSKDWDVTPSSLIGLYRLLKESSASMLGMETSVLLQKRLNENKL